MAEPVTDTHDLGTRHRILDDGRRVTLRHAVPFDAPRLTLLGSEFDGDDGRVALDDRGKFRGRRATVIEGAGLMASHIAQRVANEPTFDSMQRRSWS